MLSDGCPLCGSRSEAAETRSRLRRWWYLLQLKRSYRCATCGERFIMPIRITWLSYLWHIFSGG